MLCLRGALKKWYIHGLCVGVVSVVGVILSSGCLCDFGID